MNNIGLDFKKHFKIIIGSVLILMTLILYLTVFQNILTVCGELQQKNDDLKSKVNLLKQYEKDIDFYEDEAQKTQQKNTEIKMMFLNSFYAEDALVFVDSMENTSGIDVKNISLSQEMNSYTSEKGLILNNSQSSVSFESDYQSLKNVLSYINGYPQRKTLQSVSIVRDNTNNAFNCTALINNFTLNVGESIYTTPELSEITQGTGNLFGQGK